MPASRVAGWVERFVDSHGAVALHPASPPGVPSEAAGAVDLRAADGTHARWTLPAVDLAAALGTADDALAGVLGAVTAPRVHAVLLLRRGGGVVGVVRTSGSGAQVVGAVVRTAYVQSRTKAGGWSQQRYARRRSGQAAGLLGDVVEAAGRLWADHRADLSVGGADLCLAGDRAMIETALSAVSVLPVGAACVARLPRRQVELREDPRRRTLEALAEQAGAVLVRVREPGASSGAEGEVP